MHQASQNNKLIHTSQMFENVVGKLSEVGETHELSLTAVT